MHKPRNPLIQRLFKFYFALVLVAFVLSILLMNIPRVLAGEVVARTSDPVPAAVQTEPESTWQDGMQKLVRWKVSSPLHPMRGEGTFFELKGSRMAFTVRF